MDIDTFKNKNVETTTDSEPVLTQKEAYEARAADQQYRDFFGRGENKYAIYPSYWKDTWGKAPLLGIVFADDPYLAEKRAYDRGILPSPCNCTFQAKVKLLGPARRVGNPVLSALNLHQE